MFSDLLKTAIEAHAAAFGARNPMSQKARAGLLGPSAIHDYVENIRFLVHHVPGQLKYAEDRAAALGQTELERYYRQKQYDEREMAPWADENAARLSGGPLAPIGARPPRVPIKRLVAYIDQLIEEDPSLFLVYIFVAEYFTVLAAPPWIDDLEQHCRIPRDDLSALANYVELDRRHIAEGLPELDRLLAASQVGPDRALEVIEQALGHVNDFFTEIAGVGV